MKCYKCKKVMKYTKGLRFNEYKLDGWKCSKCGEEYYEPQQAQRVLSINKLKKQKFHLKLSKIKSNLILRLPKEISDVLDLKKGEEVEFSLRKDDEMVIHPKKAKA